MDKKIKTQEVTQKGEQKPVSEEELKQVTGGNRAPRKPMPIKKV